MAQVATRRADLQYSSFFVVALTPIPVNDPSFFQTLQLPPLPRLVTEVHGAIQAGKDPAEIAALVARDVAFSANLIRIVNSPYYALPAPVSNVRMAVAFVGLAEIARICLSLAVVKCLAPPDKEAIRSFWAQGYHSALVAQYLARTLRPRIIPVDDLYAAALLHDLGRLVYARCFPGHTAALAQQADRDAITFDDAAKRNDLPTTSRLGALVADHWRLSPGIKRACEVGNFDTLVAMEPWPRPAVLDFLVTVSGQLAVLSAGGLPDLQKNRIVVELCRVFSLDEAGFLTLMGDVYELKHKAETAVLGDD